MRPPTPCPHCDGTGTLEPWENLREIRKAAGLTLAQIAQQNPPISITYLSDVERGRRGAGVRVREMYRRIKEGIGNP
jgi:transcriptional regulator with XRE-family HTH domain